MNKQATYWFLLLSFWVPFQLQAQADCLPPSAQAILHGNDVKALFRSGGDMFWDGINQAQFQVPYSPSTTPTNATPSTLFAGSLWLGTYDAGGNLKVAAQTYRNGGSAFWSGPLDVNGQTTAGTCNDYDYIWQVRRWEIEQHQQDFDDNGLIDGPVPTAILKWPGRGNPQFAAQMGFPLVNQDMAPFYDRNGNGIYEPLMGDYPVYDHGRSDAVAEDMLWWIFNDAGNRKRFPNSHPLWAEVHATAWSFQCPGDSVLNRTIFLRQAIHNKSNLTWYDFRAGLWNDADLGCRNDDYSGVDTTLGTPYWYNQDNNDDNPCGTAGDPGYGLNPPVQAMTFLNQSLHAHIHYAGQYDPRGYVPVSLEFYRLFNGSFMDGTPMRVGGSGYDTSGTNPITRYAFFDPPLQTGGWSMYQENLAGRDARTLSSVAQDSVPVGGVFVLDVAYSYHRRAGNDHIQNVDVALQEIPQIKQWYNNDFNFNCAPAARCVNNCVYPGDMNNNGIANDYDLLDLAVAIGDGRTVAPRATPNDNWFPYDLPTPPANGYIDADGNGLLNETDWDVNLDNLYETHSLYTGAGEGFNTVGPELHLQRHYSNDPRPTAIPIYDTVVQRGHPVSFYIKLADAAQPIDDLYALLFKVTYDTTVMTAPFPVSPIGGAFSFLDTLLTGKIRYREEPGRLHYVNARLDGQGRSVYGKLGFLRFNLRADAPVMSDTMRTQVCFEDFIAIDSAGNVIPIGAQCATVEYYDTNYVTQVTPIPKAEYLAQLYPNPAQDQITLALELQQAQTLQIQLLDITGRVVYQHATQDLPKGLHHLELPTSTLPSGVYYCRIASDRQQQVLSLIKNE